MGTPLPRGMFLGGALQPSSSSALCCCSGGGLPPNASHPSPPPRLSRSLFSSTRSLAEVEVEAFLSREGLSASNLTLEELLTAVGFPKKGRFVEALRKQVQSSYGDDLFATLPLPDGSVHNVAIDEKKFAAVEKRLGRVLHNLRDEMEHITLGSLGGFGKLEPGSTVVVVLDLTEMDEANAGSYRRAVQTLISEQLQHTNGFNIFRVEASHHLVLN